MARVIGDRQLQRNRLRAQVALHDGEDLLVQVVGMAGEEEGGARFGGEGGAGGAALAGGGAEAAVERTGDDHRGAGGGGELRQFEQHLPRGRLMEIAAAETRQGIDDHQPRRRRLALPQRREVLGEVDRSALARLHVERPLDDADHRKVGPRRPQPRRGRLLEVVLPRKPPHHLTRRLGVVARLVERGAAVGREKPARHAGGKIGQHQRLADAGVPFEDRHGTGRDVPLPQPVDRLGHKSIGRREDEAAAVVDGGIEPRAQPHRLLFEQVEHLLKTPRLLEVAGLREP